MQLSHRAHGHPEHRVRERRLDQRLRVEVGSELVAESSDVIEVDEDNHPARYYFPRRDVRMDKLEPSALSSPCPYKGVARFYSFARRSARLVEAAWTYDDPYPEHAALKERIAFQDDKVPEVIITVLR